MRKEQCYVQRLVSADSDIDVSRVVRCTWSPKNKGST